MFITQLSSHFRKIRIAVVLGTVVIYVLIFLLFDDYLGQSTSILATVPVLTAAWFYGLRGGLFGGLIVFPMNLLLVTLIGREWQLWLAEGGVLGTGALLLVGTLFGRMRDMKNRMEQEVTERKRAEEEASYERELMQILLNNIPVYIYFKDENRRFVRASKFFEGLFGSSLENIVGKRDEDLFPEDVAKETIKDDLRVIETGVPIIDKIEGGESIGGEEHWVMTTKLPWKDSDGNIIGLFGISREITERKRAEKELRKHRAHLEELVQERTAELRVSNEQLQLEITERKKAEERLRLSRNQLRRLSAHLQTVREEERAQIAQEIHDELGQALTALKIDLSWINKRSSEYQEECIERIKSMIQLTDSTLQSVRRISTELRPVLLDELGIGAAIEWQVKEFADRTEIKSEITFHPKTIIVDQDRSTAIFRIFQEILTNVARHAKATRVKTKLTVDEDLLILKVVDNGKGISEEQISGSKSLGLLGMRERVYPWNGELKITGKKGKGTTVSATIPLYK